MKFLANFDPRNVAWVICFRENFCLDPLQDEEKEETTPQDNNIYIYR